MGTFTNAFIDGLGDGFELLAALGAVWIGFRLGMWALGRVLGGRA